MKKTLLAALLLVGLGSAFIGVSTAQATSPHVADPYDWRYTLADSTGTLYTFDANAIPSDTSTRYIQTMNPGSKTPEWVGINGVLRWDGMNLSVGQLPESQIDNLLTDLAAKANTNHTHNPEQINNLSSYMDGRIGSRQADWAQASTSAVGFIRNKPTLTFTTSERQLDTAFQISTSTSSEFVSYTVDISTTLSLLTGQTGTVVLEYADDSAFTTNVVTVQSAVNGNTGVLSIGLNLTQTGTASLTGMIPGGKYIRLRTVNTVGTPTFIYRAGQEIQMPV